MILAVLKLFEYLIYISKYSFIFFFVFSFWYSNSWKKVKFWYEVPEVVVWSLFYSLNNLPQSHLIIFLYFWQTVWFVFS